MCLLPQAQPSLRGTLRMLALISEASFSDSTSAIKLLIHFPSKYEGTFLLFMWISDRIQKKRMFLVVELTRTNTRNID